MEMNHDLNAASAAVGVGDEEWNGPGHWDGEDIVRGLGLGMRGLGIGTFGRGRVCHVMSRQDTSDRALQHDVLMLILKYQWQRMTFEHLCRVQLRRCHDSSIAEVKVL